MSEDGIESALGWWTAAEVAGLVALLAFAALRLFDDGTVLSSMPWPVRVAVAAFLVVELAIPLWVYYDLRRAPEGMSPLWVHAAVMPVLNVLGLVAYLSERNRRRSE